MAILSVYHPRDPKASPLWQIFSRHYDDFEKSYPEKFEKKYGFFRPVISEVVRAYLRCGDLKEGFARIRCPKCGHEYLLQFSCKVRCFCPSCQAKRVVIFGHHLQENVFYPVPHRQYVFALPKMLRIYFKHDRSLLTGLCQCAYKSLLAFLREVVHLKNGVPGVVMAIHTFGEYPDKFHPHIHIISTDGLFNGNGLFCVMRETDLKPLEDLFRAEVFKFLKKEGKINDEMIGKLMNWRHSGFSVDNGVRISEKDEKGRESVAQYIMRNVFSEGKIKYIEKSEKVIYHAKMQKMEVRSAKSETYNAKQNFKIYTAEEFIAAITQHIPKKSFQMVRYYGWYSNKSRGLRLKNDEKNTEPYTENSCSCMADNEGHETIMYKDVEIIDVSRYRPKKVPSLKWRECIKKIWKNDPLICPECLSEMRIISFITEGVLIKKILKYLKLWDDQSSRDPPVMPDIPSEIVYVPVDDGWSQPGSDLVS